MRMFLLAGCVALTGCGATKGARQTVDAAGHANPEVALQNELRRVAQTTADLYATRAGERPVVPDELQRPLTWRYSGPVDGAAMTLAQHMGYEFVAPDPGPALPAVRVNVQATPAIQIFKLVGDAAGDRAQVIVDPRRRQVQVFRHGG